MTMAPSTDGPKTLGMYGWVAAALIVYLAGATLLWGIMPPQPRVVLGTKGETFMGFSPDGRWAATQDHVGKSLRIWDVQTGQLRQSLEPTARFVHRVLFSPNSKQLVAWCLRGDCILFDVETGEVKLRTQSYGPFENRTRFFFNQNPYRFSDDGGTLALVTGQDDLELWDTASGKRRVLLPGVSRFALAPDGSTLAVSELILFRNEPAWTWDFLTAMTRVASPLPEAPAAAYSQLFTLERIRLRDLQTGETRGLPLGLMMNVTAVLFSPDGKQLVASGINAPPAVLEDRGVVQRWDMTSGQSLPAIDVHEANADVQWAGAARFTTDSRALLLNQGRGMTLWDVSARQPRRLLPYQDSAMVSPDGHWLLVRKGNPQEMNLQVNLDQRRVRLVNLQTRMDTGLLTWADAVENAWAMGFSPDNRYCFVRLSHTPQGAPADLSRNFTSLFTEDDKTELGEISPQVHMYEIASGRLVSTISLPIFAVTFTPDSQTMVFLNQMSRRAPELWDVPPGTAWARILVWPAFPAALLILLGLCVYWLRRWRSRRALSLLEALEASEHNAS